LKVIATNISKNKADVEGVTKNIKDQENVKAKVDEKLKQINN